MVKHKYTGFKENTILKISFVKYHVASKLNRHYLILNNCFLNDWLENETLCTMLIIYMRSFICRLYNSNFSSVINNYKKITGQNKLVFNDDLKG